MKVLTPHCSICLCDIARKEKITVLPCKHSYHSSCIGNWRETHITCPICRVEMPLTCCEKCNICMALPSTRCAFEILRVFSFPLSVLSIIIYFILSANKIKE